MNEPIDEIYFDWLCSKTCEVTPDEISDFTFLLRKLYTYEFAWLIAGDDNRVEDCHDLRMAFFHEMGLIVDDWLLHEMSRSVLEVLIAFSNRAAFETDLGVPYWFWKMVGNLRLNKFPNSTWAPRSEELIDAILYCFIWRQYDRKGNGGLFPLKSTTHDQREVEIWYQFSEYLTEYNYV